MRRSWIAVLTMACAGGPGGLTEDDQFGMADASPTDAPLETETDVAAPELCPAEDLVAECGTATASSLVATSDGVGRIDVVHTGVAIDGCAPWVADATVDGQVITVAYS